MRLRRVISGGQTGADRTGLEEAKKHGFETGGTVPRGCRTDEGPDPALVTEFGCVEHVSPAYPPRTRLNVRNSDATVWFGNELSPGGKLTRRTCVDLKKRFIIISEPYDLFLAAQQYEVLNVAGNRRRTNPRVVAQVRAAFATLREPMLKDLP